MSWDKKGLVFASGFNFTLSYRCMYVTYSHKFIIKNFPSLFNIFSFGDCLKFAGISKVVDEFSHFKLTKIVRVNNPTTFVFKSKI